MTSLIDLLDAAIFLLPLLASAGFLAHLSLRALRRTA